MIDEHVVRGTIEQGGFSAYTEVHVEIARIGQEPPWLEMLEGELNATVSVLPPP
jgi:hypothetical protein